MRMGVASFISVDKYLCECGKLIGINFVLFKNLPTFIIVIRTTANTMNASTYTRNFLASLTPADYYLHHTYNRLDEVTEAARMNMNLTVKEMPQAVDFKLGNLPNFLHLTSNSKALINPVLIEYALKKNGPKFEAYCLTDAAFNRYEAGL